MPVVASHRAREWAMLLGSEIKRARLHSGMAINDLASRVGVSHPTVIALESGSLKVAIGTYLEAASVLNIPLMGTDQSVRGRIETNRAIIELSPRGRSVQTEDSEGDGQVPEYF